MKSKCLSMLLALCLLLTLPLTAMAVETALPSASSVSIASNAGTTYTSVQDGAAKRLDIPQDAVLDLTAITMETSEAVSLGNVAEPGANSVYADGTNLKIKLRVNGSDATVASQMSSADGIHWTGTGSASMPGVTDLPVGALANELANTGLTVAAGVLVAGERQSAAGTITINQDSEKVYLYLYPASVAAYTVTYQFGDSSYAFTVPAGSSLVNVQVPAMSGQTFGGWCTDAACETPADLTQPVTANVTLYGAYTPDETETSFDAALDAVLEGGTAAYLPIATVEDFETFVARASEVPAGQLVQLQNDLDLTNKTYSSISGFQGDFNGGNHTITGAEFTAVGQNAGMFATLGAGQVVANLTLDGITVSALTKDYAGTLVGSAGGTESAGSGQVTIQNIHVTDCTARGRTAGGIAGFIIWTDVKYCSVQSGTINGVVNGGGIVGISYNNVTDCYSKVEPTALMRSGGIVGNNLDTVAFVTHCWCVDDKITGNNVAETYVVGCVSDVSRQTTKAQFDNAGFSETIWTTSNGQNTTLKAEAIVYVFAN